MIALCTFIYVWCKCDSLKNYIEIEKHLRTYLFISGVNGVTTVFKNIKVYEFPVERIFYLRQSNQINI